MNSRLSSVCSAYTTSLLFFMPWKRTLEALYTIPEDEDENEVNPYPIHDPAAWIRELDIRVLVFFPERLPEFWLVLQQVRNRTSATADCIVKVGTRAGFLATAGWTWSYDGPHVNWTPPESLLLRLESLDQRCDCDTYSPELCEPDSCGRGWDAQTAGETFQPDVNLQEYLTEQPAPLNFWSTVAQHPTLAAAWEGRSTYTTDASRGCILKGILERHLLRDGSRFAVDYRFNGGRRTVTASANDTVATATLPSRSSEVVGIDELEESELCGGQLHPPQSVTLGQACTRADITASNLLDCRSPFYDVFPAATVETAAARGFGGFVPLGAKRKSVASTLPSPQLGGWVKVTSPAMLRKKEAMPAKERATDT